VTKLAAIFLSSTFATVATFGAAASNRQKSAARETPRRRRDDVGRGFRPVRHLLPRFAAATAYTVRVVSRASATALLTAEKGTIDAVIVNDGRCARQFRRGRSGHPPPQFHVHRFVIVGPSSDPAGVRGMNDASTALREIARKRATFVSRGDNSGTHTAELKLWQAAGVNPKARSGNWYRETGLGMGLTCRWPDALAPTR